MSSASLPPLPALIPIAALRKSPPSNNNSGAGDGGHRDCAPCANRTKIMGEQRSRRPGRQPSVDLIDSARSRGSSAAPQSRKIRTERHRKSDRRRDRHRRAKTKLDIEKHHSDNSPERPVNPRVNPIFVWVRQEDTRIVEVKCEDYDKRNRILLTKTPQGWRATPRTETLVPSLKEEADKKHHHHHRSKKSKKHKTKQKSTAVQVDEMSDEHLEEAAEESSQQDPFPSWELPVNVESLLPSHTIHVPRKNSNSPGAEQSPPNSPSVNSGNDSAQTQSKCSADKLCDLSLLDNLLAVAELEFNQQIESGEWNESSQTEDKIDTPVESQIDDEEQKILTEALEQLTNLNESCVTDNEGKLATNEFIAQKEECDYTEDDENNSAMGEVLTRIELSLQSPVPLGPSSSDTTTIKVNTETPSENLKQEVKEETNEKESLCEESEPNSTDAVEQAVNAETIDLTEEEITASEVPKEDLKPEEPTDLSIRPKGDLTIEIPSKDDDSEQPTDLSVPRKSKLSPLLTPTLRPPSQSSEALQSPQPSGIPAVPPSPDILSPSTSSTCNSRSRATFLESLLATTSPKMALNSEVTIERQKEPLDLGKCRKSASPTITCSEEVKHKVSEEEPPTKKLKTSGPITLKDLLDNVMESKKNEEKTKNCQDSPKLLELLNTEAENPIAQLHLVLSDKTLNVPDPMLVPKEVLSKIIANPAKEIPELLKCRPELRLPEALAFPHLLQDPDILVITLQQLETIIRKQNQPHSNKQSIAFNKNDLPMEKMAEKPLQKRVEKESSKSRSNKIEETVKMGHAVRDFKRKSCNELADVDVSANSAFNQMFWLPYMNQMEALQFGGNADFMKMLVTANMPTTFPTQMSDLSHLLTNNRYPAAVPQNIPMHYNNPLELQMWQEAMLQANSMEMKNASSGDARNSFKDFMNKMNYSVMSKPYMQNHKFPMQNKQNLPNQFFQTQPTTSNISNPYMNLPQAYQSNMNLQHPQFNPMFAQKNMEHPKHKDAQMNMSYTPHDKSNFPKTSSQHGRIRTKPAYKLMNNVPPHPKEKFGDGPPRQLAGQPIDLSGATTTTEGKLKARQHLMESWNHRKLLRHEDIPEVGSTTASIEEMQEAHKHLWHPLFGNEKGYNTPWNWTSSATATAE